MRFVLFIARRYIGFSGKQFFFNFIIVVSLIGVMLGTCATIVVTSVMSGFSDNLRDKILGANGHITLYSASRVPIDDWEKVKDILVDIDGVSSVSPFVGSQVILGSAVNMNGVNVRGVDSVMEMNTTNLGSIIVSGNLSDIDNYSYRASERVINIAIGKRLASLLLVDVDDTVSFMSPLGKRTAFGYVPKVMHARIAAVFDTGMYDYDMSLAYVGLKSLQKFISMGDRVSGFMLKIDDIGKSDKLAREIETKFNMDFRAVDWKEANKNLFGALKLERYALFIILTLIILVSAFNIVSVITISIKDKKKAICILRAMGASSKSIIRIFTIIGMFPGVLGTVLGNILALLINSLFAFTDIFKLSEEVYNMTSVPVNFMPNVFLATSVVSLFITFVASYVSARQVSKVDIIEGIRNE